MLNHELRQRLNWANSAEESYKRFQRNWEPPPLGKKPVSASETVPLTRETLGIALENPEYLSKAIQYQKELPINVIRLLKDIEKGLFPRP